MASLDLSMDSLEASMDKLKLHRWSTYGMVFCKRAECPNSKVSGVQMSACSKCLRVAYCSKECQASDWDRHKPECQILNRRRKDPTSTGGAPATQVSEELGAFRKRFQPTIFLAALNAFSVSSPGPVGWRDHAFYIDLERLPAPTPESRPWSRFRLHEANILPLPERTEGSQDHYDVWKERRDARMNEREKDGLCVISIFITCKWAGSDLLHPFDLLYPMDTPLRLNQERVGNWLSMLRGLIELQCGR